jgi:hypothetical protein
MAVSNTNAATKVRKESVSSESDSLVESSDDNAASASLSSAAVVSLAPSSASSKQASHLAQVHAPGAAPTTTAAPHYNKAALSTARADGDVESDEENDGGHASARGDSEEALASSMGGVALDEGSGHEFGRADAGPSETGDGGSNAQTAGTRMTAGKPKKAQRTPILASYETKLDKAIRKGETLKVAVLLTAGTGSANWIGLDVKAMKHLPKLFEARDEAALLAAIEKHDFSLDQLARANRGADLLKLACRIDSVKLARAWINAHPDSLTFDLNGNVPMRRTQLGIPIWANSFSITKLMLDMGAIPGQAEIAAATGEIKKLLETRADALPWAERYD